MLGMELVVSRRSSGLPMVEWREVFGPTSDLTWVFEEVEAG